MGSTTVRINSKTRDILRRFSQGTGKKMQEIIEEACELYRRERFLEEANRGFAALRSNPEAWAEEEKERKVWDITLSDSLKK